MRIDDRISKFVKAATDILIVKNPIGTSLGIIFGALMYYTIFTIGLYRAEWEPATRVGPLAYVCLGMFLFNFPKYIQGKPFDPNMEKSIYLIDEMRENGASQAEVRRMYEALYLKTVLSVDLNKDTRQKVEEILSGKGRGRRGDREL